MASTRFFNDPHKVKTHVENSSYAGKYYLNPPAVEGGAYMPYQEDPHIRLQGWGANMMTNSIGIENELKGLTRRIQRDDPETVSYGGGSSQFADILFSSKIKYPNERKLNADETRASNPAWLLRGIEIPRWEDPILNPQAFAERQTVNELILPPPTLDEWGNITVPDNGININTRILEKDNYRPDYFTEPPAVIPAIPLSYPFI